MWRWVLAACVVAYVTKLSGYLIPHRWLEKERVVRTTRVLTVGLLAALTAISTVATGQRLVVDSRLLALLVAGVLLWRRAPYLVVVLGGALAAACGRLAGLP